MSKLAWLEGAWRGEGWRARPGGRDMFNVTETIYFKLHALILILEGRGWSIGENGAEIERHKAFGVLSYDAYAQTYRFDAFVKQGYQSRAEPQLCETEYRWSQAAGPGAEMRYHARLTADGEWFETGEHCVDEECVQIFEMRLNSIEAD